MKSNRKLILGLVGAAILGFLVLQVIPISTLAARTNPPVTTQIKWDSPETEKLVRTACYDCHSNETVWPWYAYVAPISWLVTRDVAKGRNHVNFSETPAEQLDVDSLIEQVQRGSMPPSKYTLLHPTAKLSEEQRTQLVQGFQASLGTAAIKSAGG